MTAVAHHHELDAERDALAIIVLFLVERAPVQPVETHRLQNLVFLTDREHVRSFDEPLTNLRWQASSSGVTSQELHSVFEQLLAQGMLRRWTAQPPTPQAIGAYSAPTRHASWEEWLSPRAERSLSRVLSRYGHLTEHDIRAFVLQTRALQGLEPGEPIDPKVERLPERAAVREESWPYDAPVPQTDRRAWGDPAASAAEDQEIMDAMAGWRAEANRELLDE